jgi:hypothetical protein
MKPLSKLFKLPIEYYVVIVLLFIVISMSIYSAKSYQPYEINTSLNGYPYEGFQNEQEYNSNSNTMNVKGGLGTFEAEAIKASPIDAPSIHDPVSKLQGKHECVGQSIYTNSSGGLCLTDDVRRAFETRGGNR